MAKSQVITPEPKTAAVVPVADASAMFVLSGGGPVDGSSDELPASAVVFNGGNELHIPSPPLKVMAIYTLHKKTATQAFYHLARTEPL